MTQMQLQHAGNGSVAVLSDDGVYRYSLSRWWKPVRCPEDQVCWVMLNPSTADATVDDPTIRRCTGFSKAWGFNGLVVVNVFALRATDPRELVAHAEPVGPRCDEFLENAMRTSGRVVVAWGASWPSSQRSRIARVAGQTHRHQPVCLGVTASRQPRHPLYLPKNVEVTSWS